MATPLSIGELATSLVQRTPQTKVSATFIFGRAQGDWEATEGDSGILETAAQFYRDGKSGEIYIPDTMAGLTFSGAVVPTMYPGPEAWITNLQNLGVPPDNVGTITPTAIHTRGESDGFVALCKQRNWFTVAVIMQKHQVLRTALAMLKSFKEQHHHLHIRFLCPEKMNWNKHVYGSQGEHLLPRSEHARIEIEKVLAQQEAGFLATFAQLEEYLAMGA